MSENAFVSQALIRRYLDAYFVARVLKPLAMLLKGLGLLGGVIFAAKLRDLGVELVVAILFALGMMLNLFIWGVLLPVVHEILQAVMDTAINTSPFLSEAQKLEAMRVSKGFDATVAGTRGWTT